VDLKSRTSTESLARALGKWVKGRDRAIIYLDTWQRTISPAPTTDAEAMQRAAENAEWLGQELRAAIVCAAHPPKGANTKGPNLKAFTISGAGEIENVSQALWFINPQGKSKDHIKLECMRMKGPGEGECLPFHRKVVPIAGLDNFGKPRTSVILVKEGAAPKGTTAMAITDADLEALKGLRDMEPNMGRARMAEALGWSEWKVRQAQAKLDGQDIAQRDRGP
jgi:hypothetical protein